MNFDQQQTVLVIVFDEYIKNLDARLPLTQTLLDVVASKVRCSLVVGRKSQAFEITTEGRPHHALAERSAQDDMNRFLDSAYSG